MRRPLRHADRLATRVVLREYEAVGWEHKAGPTMGWNDLDTLDVGDGTLDGLTQDEKQSAITLPCRTSSPLSSCRTSVCSMTCSSARWSIDPKGKPTTTSSPSVVTANNPLHHRILVAVVTSPLPQDSSSRSGQRRTPAFRFCVRR
jgi:hypothetical protein